MKTRIIPLLLALALITITRAAEASAKTLKQCPSGHTTLKDVPIAYGLPPFKGPAAEKWKRSVENLEFVTGGCSYSSDSPKHEVICTTCRFAHSISSTRDPQYGSWTRTSPDAKSFPKPIADLVKSFPLSSKEQEEAPVKYTQNLSDGMEVRLENVSYYTTRPADEIKTDVDKWLKEQNIKCSFSSQTITSDLDGAVRDILTWKTEELSVDIDVHYEHSDKTSWVFATVFKRP
jgi:hypothetical protein